MSKQNKGIIEIVTVFIAVYLIPFFIFFLIEKIDLPGMNLILPAIVCLFMALIPCLVVWKKKIDWKKFGFWKTGMGWQILWGIIIFAVLFTIFILLPILLGADPSKTLGVELDSVKELVGNILFYFFFVAAGEEILFRGYFYTRIMYLSDNPRLAIFLSSIFYGVAHLQSIWGIRLMFNTMIHGFVYSIARYKFKNCSLLSLIIAHALHDSMIDVLSFILL